MNAIPLATEQASLLPERQRPGTAAEWLMLGALTLIIAGLGAHGARLGLSSHGDSRAIVEGSIPAILSGTYHPSRSLGNPLYEVMAALIYRATGSLTAINGYSVLLAIVALFGFARLLPPFIGVSRRALVLAGFALNPLVLINSSTVIEWMQVVLLVVLVLVAVQSWLSHRGTAALVGYGVSSALLVLTRPDAVVFCAALFLALLWETRFAPRPALELTLVNAIAGLSTAAVWLAINHGPDLLLNYVITTQALLRRLGLATMGMLDIFGLLGTPVLLGFALVLARRALGHGRTETSFWSRLFLLAGPLLFARFVWQPDKLEYMLPLVVVVLLAVAHERLATGWVAVVAVSMVLTSAVCVSLFKRAGGGDRLSLSIGVNRGALAQDWEVTRHYRLVTTQGFLRKLSDIVYATDPVPRPRLHAYAFGVGIVSDDNDLIIGEEQHYQLDNARIPAPRFKRESYRRIYVCGGSLMGFRPGWRVWQRPPSLPRIDPRTDQLDLRCAREVQVASGRDQDF